MNIKKFSALCLTSIITFNAFSALADTSTSYNNYDAIPTVLLKNIRNNTYREQYISNTLSFIRKNGENKLYFSKGDLKAKEEAVSKEQSRRQLSNVMRYDQNLDGQVTIDEVKWNILKNSPQYKETKNEKRFNSEVKKITVLDQNNNGVITFEEMVTLSPKKISSLKNGMLSQYKEYYELDPNKDEKLTLDELKKLAMMAFSTVDKDNNSIISEEEFNLTKKTNLRNSINISPSCELPKVSENTKLISVGVYEGEAMSSVTASDHYTETNAIEVNINEDVSNNYIILSSHTPMIWNIKGNSESIDRLVIYNSAKTDTGTSKSGVTGIEKDKVIFLNSDCMNWYHEVSKPDGLKAKYAINKMTGRYPDHLAGKYKTKSVNIDSSGVVFGSDKENQTKVANILASKGFNKGLLIFILRHYPAGLEEIKTENVIAENKVERYEIFPQLIGIAELARKGFIEIIDYRNFRIVKEIPRYPAGLGGGHSVTFIIAKGVKPPEGSAGHSCVILEETGEVLSGKYSCR